MTKDHDSGHAYNSFATAPPLKNSKKRSKAQIGLQGEQGNSAGFESERIIPGSGVRKLGPKYVTRSELENGHFAQPVNGGSESSSDMQEGWLKVLKEVY